MLRSGLLRVLLPLSIVALGSVPSLGVDIHDLEGAWSRYRVATDHVSLPLVDTLVLSTPRVETTPDGDALWFQMEAYWERTRVFALAILVSDVAFLEGAGAPAIVHRYILLPQKGDPLEYVDEPTGEAYLPRFGLFEGLLPRAPSGSPAPLIQLEEYLGRALVLDRASPVGARMLADFTGHPILELDDRVLIGSSRHFRDDGTGRQIDYQYIPPRVGDYSYVPLEKADYDEMIEAGFNLFRVPVNHLDHVLAEPVFFLVHQGTTGHPELFYRSNYWGGVMYLDEPEVRVAFEDGYQDIVTPEAAADALIGYTADTHQGSTMYGSRYLASMTAQEDWDLGPHVDLTELATPSWVTFHGSGWYQMEAGVQNLVHGYRIVPSEYSAHVQDRFGVDFPADAEPWIRFFLGTTTGAVQRFGGGWGVSIMGQMDEDAADLLFPMAYERGARFFWVWTSDRDHHLPHERQLEIVRNFRDWIENDSGYRPRDSRPLVAISLPWGYSCDHASFRGQLPGPLWFRSAIRLDDLNSSGVEYREVLAAYYRTYLERIAAGEEVDLIYLRPEETFTGDEYDAVYRVLPTGGLQAGATSAPSVTPSLSALRLVVRPNPFVRGTNLGFHVPHPAVTSVRVHEAGGRLIRTVVPESRLDEGSYVFWWNGLDDAGSAVAPGVYFARTVIGETEGTKKIVRLR